MGVLTLRRNERIEIKRVVESVFTPNTIQTYFNYLVNLDPVFRNLAGNIRFGQGMNIIIDDLLLHANMHGILDWFLSEVSTEFPYRPEVRALALHLARDSGWTAGLELHQMPLRQAFEAATSSGRPFVDAGILARWMIGVERHVCQVRCGDKHGTGFLVGPDMVLTCYHVVAAHLNGSVPAKDVKTRFDYRRLQPYQDPPNPTDWIGIDPNWDIPHSPTSPRDVDQVGPMDSNNLPKATELDYALVKLQRRIGLDRPDSAKGDSRQRGWIDLATEPALPETNSPVLIVQHPGGQPQMPLQIAFSTPGVAAINDNHTRVEYTPSTLGGSSGSPVYDRTLQAVALHHNYGQYRWEKGGYVTNRGIPLRTIRAALDDAVRATLPPPPTA